jgi:ribosomal protein S18 acetylase RimI-like enzyme
MSSIEFRERPELRNADLEELLGGPYDYLKILARSLTWIGAFDDERLIGYANVAWDGSVHAFLLDPTVHPDYRHRGIGTRLVKEALSATARVAEIEWMHVDADDDLMEKFYLPAGFRPAPAGLVWMDDLRGAEEE